MKKKNIILLGIVAIIVVVCILAVVIGFGSGDRKDKDDNEKPSVKLSQELLDDKETSTKSTTGDETTTEESSEKTTNEDISEQTSVEETSTEETTTEETTEEKESSEASTESQQKEELNRFSYEYMIIDGESVYKEYNGKIIDLYEELNAKRVEEGLSELVFDEEISYVACARASQIAYNGNISEDANIKYYDLMKESGLSFSKAVENTAAGYESPEELLSETETSWCTSEKHYENIISDNYTRVGVGVDYSESMGYIWVAIFSN